MKVRVVDVQDGILIPTVHVYSLKSLKGVVDDFPDNYLKILLYVYYMTYPDPSENPFFNIQAEDKEEMILKEIGADFSTDHPSITAALDFMNKIYDTPTKRAYEGAVAMMDKIATLFKTTSLTTGRDGSTDSMVRTMEKYDSLRQSFKGVEKDYKEEIKEMARGDSFTAYDMQ